MPRYPRVPLEQKLIWMRQRQREKAQKEADAAKPSEERQVIKGAAPQVKDSPKESPQYAAPGGNGIPRERQMLRVDEVAAMLSVSPRTVQRWFAGRALVVHSGPSKTTMLISQKTLDEWFAEHEPSSR